MQLGETYLITGGAGFVGCNLTRLLLREGKKVIGIDNFENSSPEAVSSFNIYPGYMFFRGNVITDFKLLEKLVKMAHVVIHLAASVGVTNATEYPSFMLKSNIAGMVNVVDLCVKHNKRLIVSSSSEVYGWSPIVPFEEMNDLVVPNPYCTRFSYALSKLVEEYYCIGFVKTHDLKCTVIRLFNSTGVGQNTRNNLVLPSLVDQALKNEDITVYGNGEQTRCFCDVSETVMAIYLLRGCEESIGKVVNIGTDKETKIIELAKMIKRISGSSSRIKFVPYADAFGDGFKDMMSRVPNLSLINKLVGWVAKIDLEDIVTNVIKYEKNRRGI